MVSSGNSYIDQLLEQAKALFSGKQQFARPLTPTAPAQPEWSGAGQSYTPPIHDTWHSSGGFTYQPNPTHPSGHMGVDMRAPAGTPVYPLAPGIVSNVGTDPKGGNVVNVKHANNVTTYYAHLSTIRVQKGDKVGPTTVLGTVGNTGNASHTFPHLHFQVWKDGQITDPATFFSVPKYTDLSAQEKANPWVSEEAKQEAAAFNMRDHLAQRRVAFSREVEKLSKIAEAFYLLSNSSKTSTSHSS